MSRQQAAALLDESNRRIGIDRKLVEARVGNFGPLQYDIISVEIFNFFLIFSEFW